MNVTALSKKERDYTPDELKGKPNAPVFQLRSLTRLEYLEVMASSGVDMPADLISDGIANPDEIAKKLTSGSMSSLYNMSISTIKTNHLIMNMIDSVNAYLYFI